LPLEIMNFFANPMLPPPAPPSLSHSLSHTHTHTCMSCRPSLPIYRHRIPWPRAAVAGRRCLRPAPPQHTPGLLPQPPPRPMPGQPPPLSSARPPLVHAQPTSDTAARRPWPLLRPAPDNAQLSPLVVQPSPAPRCHDSVDAGWPSPPPLGCSSLSSTIFG
jgi:hypothetical protein